MVLDTIDYDTGGPFGSGYEGKIEGYLPGGMPSFCAVNGLMLNLATINTVKFGWSGAGGSAPEPIFMDASTVNFLNEFDDLDDLFYNVAAGDGYFLSDAAVGVVVETSGFSKNLTSADDTVQKVAAVVDQLGTGASNVEIIGGATNIERGDNLKAAYAAAKATGGWTKTSRKILFCPAIGDYDMDGTPLVMDVECIDIVGEGISRNLGTDWTGPFITPDTGFRATSSTVIQLEADDVMLKGLRLAINAAGSQLTDFGVKLTRTDGHPNARFVDIYVVKWGGLGQWHGIETTESLIASYFEQCHMPDVSLAEGNGGTGTVSGTFIDCTGLEVCASYVGIFSGLARRVYAVDYGFGKTFSGKAYDCHTGNMGFAGIGPGIAIFSGYAERCSCAEEGFGASQSSGTCTFTSTGVSIDCEAGKSGFGKTSFAGKAIRCKANGVFAFGNYYLGSGMTGEMIDCHAESDRTTSDIYPALTVGAGGKVKGCYIKSTASNNCILLIADGAAIHDCELDNDGTRASIAGAFNAKITHCRSNTDIDAATTNLVENGYNVVDSDI
jgi:hypothetical protein